MYLPEELPPEWEMKVVSLSVVRMVDGVSVYITLMAAMISFWDAIKLKNFKHFRSVHRVKDFGKVNKYQRKV